MARKRKKTATSKTGRKYKRKGGKWVQVQSHSRHPPHKPPKYHKKRKK